MDQKIVDRIKRDIESGNIIAAREHFLAEMLSFYREDPAGRRSMYAATGSCWYRLGKKACAIGRWIPDEDYKPDWEGSTGVMALSWSSRSWLAELGGDFCSAVQMFHDQPQNWGETHGVSDTGMTHLSLVCKAHALDMDRVLQLIDQYDSERIPD